jgi:hypothetical protein
MHVQDIKDRFIGLRARGSSLPRIAAAHARPYACIAGRNQFKADIDDLSYDRRLARLRIPTGEDNHRFCTISASFLHGFCTVSAPPAKIKRPGRKALIKKLHRFFTIFRAGPLTPNPDRTNMKKRSDFGQLWSDSSTQF